VILFDKKKNKIKSHYDCIMALILNIGLYHEEEGEKDGATNKIYSSRSKFILSLFTTQ
jgi:hypothetical protein